MKTCKECFKFKAELDEAGYCIRCRPTSDFSSSPPIPTHATKRGVRNQYTTESLADSLKAWRASGASLRTIANSHFEGRVSHSVIQKCLQGEFPKSNDIREALGLPPLIRVSSVNGDVAEGALTLGSKLCRANDCEVSFIPNCPSRIYCYVCSPPSSFSTNVSNNVTF